MALDDGRVAGAREWAGFGLRIRFVRADDHFCVRASTRPRERRQRSQARLRGPVVLSFANPRSAQWRGTECGEGKPELSCVEPLLLLVWRRDAMKKIRIIEHISLDGVIQAPGGLGEDGDYPYGGWTVPHADPAVGEVIVAAHREAFDLLLGRRTYDIWSGYWPKAGKSPMADSLNAATKYVATHRPDSLGWGPVED